MKPTPTIHAMLSLLLICAMTVSLTGCGAGAKNPDFYLKKVQAADLMDSVKAGEVSGKAADDTFLRAQMKLTVDLFKSSVQESKNENVLISPLSIQLALAMTANGADGETRKEMEALLGDGLSIEELNKYLYTRINSLPSEDKYKLGIANSIWFRDDENRLTVEQDFLQTNADYYDAQIYKSAFDDQTVKDINHWVAGHTNGMIDEILDQIDPDTVMYLINALVFDAKWEKTYELSDIWDGTFTAVSGDTRKVKMMNSTEGKYLDDGKATGFIKDYKDGKYSFAALLPNENVDIYDYIDGLTNEGLLQTIKNAGAGSVMAIMPKFSYEYELTMNDLLKKLGMPSAFNRGIADFSKLGHSSYGNIYIGNVLHKTFIAVDELGTKAGAVTSVEMKNESAMLTDREVRLDRPFVYMIIENGTGLPIFIGTVMDIEK